jgi:hypothetical protein
MSLRTKVLLLLFALVVAVDLLLVLNSVRGCVPRSGAVRKTAERGPPARRGLPQPA